MEQHNIPKLRVSREEATKRIQAQIEEGQKLLNRNIDSDNEMDKAGMQANNWSKFNTDLLALLFAPVPIDDYEKFHYRRLDIDDMDSLNITYGITDFSDYQKGEYRTDISDSINSLEGILNRLELYDEPKGRPRATFGNNIFVVHGHDEATKHIIAGFIKAFELNPIILDEKANEGQTIIEKFEAHAEEAGYAIILLTPDDVGARKDDREQLKLRARQNVILELGYFLGVLGRERVCVLHKEKVELPSDLHGVLYVPLDSNEGWKFKLAREIKQAGLPVDLNKLVPSK